MDLDLTLPPPAQAVVTYAMAVRSGGMLFVSGHGAFEDGRPFHTGRLGESLTTEQGAHAAEVVMLGLLATARDELGDLGRVERVVVRVGGFVVAGGGTAPGQGIIEERIRTCLTTRTVIRQHAAVLAARDEIKALQRAS